MMIDVARARADTPGCERVLHFNNAGASLMPRQVVDRVISHLELEAAVGGYRAAREAADELADVKAVLAELLGADGGDGIALTDSATRAWDMAFYGLDIGPGERILTAEAEYASNYLAFLHRARQRGCVVEAVPSTGDGSLDVDALESMIDDRVKLIAVTHVPTNGGLVNPAAEVGTVARRHGITYLLDATQSVGQLPVDVARIGCDLLAGTSRKYLRGPRGVGFLWVRAPLIDTIDPPFVELQNALWTAPGEYELANSAVRFETWESDVAARLGLGLAVRYALGWGIESIQHWVNTLADLLRRRLMEIPRIVVTDLGLNRCGIVTFTVDGIAAAEVASWLQEMDINVEHSSASSTLLDMQRRGLEGVVRASVHYFNTEQEVERFCDEVAVLSRSS